MTTMTAHTYLDPRVSTRKTYIPRVKQATGSRSFTFIASTETPDRDHDVIHGDGWSLDNYKKNPVIQFAHDYHSLPVGRATDVHVRSDGKLQVTIEFATAEMNPMGEYVYQMVAKGFLNAVSVGFNPTRFGPNGQGGMDFDEQELLEVSIVPVPANPQALIAAKAAGLNLYSMNRWKKFLKSLPSIPLPNYGGGTPTAPFLPDPTGGDYSNPAKDEDEQDDLDEQSTRPPVYGRGKKRKEDEEETDEEARRRKEEEEEEDDEDLVRRILALLKEEEEEEEERKRAKRRKEDRLETDDTYSLEDQEDDDPLHSPSGTIPIGPKAVATAARCGQDLYSDEGKLVVLDDIMGKRVAVCPKGPECPHKANQSIEHCPAKRDCPLIWDAQHHPGSGPIVSPIPWMPADLRVNPRTSFESPAMKARLERELAARAGLGRGNVGCVFGEVYSRERG